MTKKEELAIARMNRALKELDRLGIKICGMDSNIIYATKQAYLKGKEISDEDMKRHSGGYCPVACAYQISEEGTGSFKADCYTDSGGW